MKNKEVYKTLIDSISENGKFGYRVNKDTGLVSSCDSQMFCDSCLFYKSGDALSYDECSAELIDAWENTEYGEPFDPSYWNYMPRDAKIQVRNEGGTWTNAHFAKYQNGHVFTYAYGKTSWTERGEQLIPWDEARLLEGMC